MTTIHGESACENTAYVLGAIGFAAAVGATIATGGAAALLLASQGWVFSSVSLALGGACYAE